MAPSRPPKKSGGNPPRKSSQSVSVPSGSESEELTDEESLSADADDWIEEVVAEGEAPSEIDAEAPSARHKNKSNQRVLAGEVIPVRSGQVIPSVEGSDEPEDGESKSPAVFVNDPLRAYLEDLKRYPLLEPEEEMQLALKLRDSGDIDAAKKLVSANLRLVVKIAFEYGKIYQNILDLIQEGNYGLMKAVSKYDPTKGARLGYYASWWIRSYILKYILDNFRLVKIGTTQAQKKLFYHLVREKEKLEAQGLLAGPLLLAEKLEVREKDVLEMQQRLSGAGNEMSIDAPLSSGDGDGRSSRFSDFLVDGAVLPDEKAESNQLVKMLQDRLPEIRKTLNDREQKVLEDRLLSDEPKTLQEVADLYGLTRERVRQIEQKVLLKIRAFFQKELENQ